MQNVLCTLKRRDCTMDCTYLPFVYNGIYSQIIIKTHSLQGLPVKTFKIKRSNQATCLSKCVPRLFEIDYRPCVVMCRLWWAC